MADRLRVTQIKSTIGHIARNRGTVRALGLKRIGHTVEVPDNPATRGMVRQVRFLVEVETVGAARSPASRETAAASAPATTPDRASHEAATPADGPVPEQGAETPAATPRPRRAKPTAAAKEKA